MQAPFVDRMIIWNARTSRRLALVLLSLGLAASGEAVTARRHSDQREGAQPLAGLITDGAAFYGTTAQGGSFGQGAVFRVDAGGTYTLLHAFKGGADDGAHPQASLVLDPTGTLYGTTAGGGAGNLGTVFSLGRDGSGYRVLHAFAGGSEGSAPTAALITDGIGDLFGTTSRGDANSFGSVFTLRTDGSGFFTLHTFTGVDTDGANPNAAVAFDRDQLLYGTTSAGGTLNQGTVFAMHPNGQGFILRHSFGTLLDANGNAIDGQSPMAPVIPDGTGWLYGTASGGGTSGSGTVFKVRSDGSAFVVLHSFEPYLRQEGASPQAPLVIDPSGNLYGTTTGGGPQTLGTAFRLTIAGTGFVVLHNFSSNPADGAQPFGGLTFSPAGVLYGTTAVGAAGAADRGGPVEDAGGAGTVFEMNPDGSGFALVHSFARSTPVETEPLGGVIADAQGNLYGTTSGGGDADLGTVFRVQRDGSGFVLLHVFEGTDGAIPAASLVLDDAGTLYGTTVTGGDSDLGTAFAIKTDGSGFTVLHSFATSIPNPLGYGPFIDRSSGTRPRGPLFLDGAGNVYGTASDGGGHGAGTVFTMRTDGSGFVVLHDFDGAAEGAAPNSGLVLAGGLLYGTASSSGRSNYGTIFALGTDGTGFHVVHGFGGFTSTDGGRTFQPALDGATPLSGLVADESGNLYGTTSAGGTGQGVVYRVTADGTITLLHVFNGADGAMPYASLVLDGGNLYGTTYTGGATATSPSAVPPASSGTAFRLLTDGTGFELLHVFTGGAADGGNPQGTLFADGLGHYFGTASQGGAFFSGTVFELTEPVPFDGNPGVTFTIVRALGDYDSDFVPPGRGTGSAGGSFR
jgi:uncharacterized repeat protein (TIGR03803 family)